MSLALRMSNSSRITYAEPVNTTRPFELLHMDLFSPNHYSAVTNDASFYGFVIVDDYSRYTWLHIVTYKHEVQEIFK